MENLCYNCFAERQDEVGVCPFCGYDNAENTTKYPTALRSGSILNGHYIIGRVLGQGGFGITYLAFDYQLKVKVAIKEYMPDGMATRLPDTTLVSVYVGEKQENFNYGAERFLDEARVLAKFIGNRNIVGVKSYFDENNTSYFVMDYIEGISFKSYIANKGGKIDYKDAERILTPVLRALSAVHREGFIHRDITPDNIYITKDGEIKLLDFGSARYSLGDKSKSLDVILKAGYAPKEQYIRRGKQGPYTDVYSVAACFYASVTGYLPPEALERMENDELVEFSARGVKLPGYLDTAIMKGLEVRAEDRYQSADEFLAVIEAGQMNEATQATVSEQTVTVTQVSGTPQAAPQFAYAGHFSGTPQAANPEQPIVTGGYPQPQQISGTPVTTYQPTGAPPEVPSPTAPVPRQNNKKVIAIVVGIAAAFIIFTVSLIGILAANINDKDLVTSSSQSQTVSSTVSINVPISSSSASEKTPVIMYKNTNVPDFGMFMGIALVDKSSSDDGVSYNVYRYSLDDLTDDAVDKYTVLIRSVGFKAVTDEKITGIDNDALWYSNADTYIVMTYDYDENYEEYFDIEILSYELLQYLLAESYNQYGNTSGNTANVGIASIQGDWVYYSNPADGGSLYKVLTDGTEKTWMTYDNVCWINVVEDWVYYSNASDDYKLYKIKTDGSGRIKLNDDDSRSVIVYDGWIYYANRSDGYSVHRMHTDGSGDEKLNSDDSWCLSLVDDWIYYRSDSDNFALYKMRVSGTDRTKVSSDQFNYLSISDGWIYYENTGDDGRLYKMRTDGSGRERLLDCNVWCVNSDGDWIYYRDFDSGCLNKVRIDGTENTILAYVDCTQINVVGDWIYFYEATVDTYYKIRTDGTEFQQLS